MNPDMHDDLNIPEQPHDYNNEGIVLQPFLHQVSGRAAILSLDKTTVCKPLNYREHKFYKSLPPDIKQFTPRYKGIVNVNVEEAPDGSVAFTAYPSKSEDLETSFEDTNKAGSGTTSNGGGGGNNSTTTEQHNHHQQQQSKSSFFSFMDGKHGETNMSTSSTATTSFTIAEQDKFRDYPSPDHKENDEDDDDDDEDEDLFLRNPGHHTDYYQPATVNPWIFKVQREGLRRYLQSEKRTQKCILLENVASRFRKPCILDLKMGTRVHGDYDDHDKQLRHQKKSAATTTKKLGVRLCGMQVYDSQSDSFHCRDKYFGRTLDRNALRAALRRFFRNDGDGRHTRREIILTVIERLQAIKNSLTRLGSYRFYSSSLLIIYDGDGSQDDVTNDQNTPSPNTTSSSPSSDHGNVAGSSSNNHNSDNQFPSSPTTSTTNNAAAAVPRVDIRMVDFAKSTNRHLDGAMVHEGPDLGYIFGLTNLIKLLSEIAQQTIPANSDNDDVDFDDEEL